MNEATHLQDIWTETVQLSALTLVPIREDSTPLTPEKLKSLILELSVDADGVEHVKVVERSGLMWVGAYISIRDDKSAQHHLVDLCARVTDVIDGWEIIRQPDL